MTIPLPVYVVCTVWQAILAILAVRLFCKRTSISALTLILPIVAAVYVNVIVLLGSPIDNRFVFVAHQWAHTLRVLLTPAWIITATGFAQRAGATFMRTKIINIGQWVLYATCVVLGFIIPCVAYVVYVITYPRTYGFLAYYRHGGSFLSPPVETIFMLIVVLICAIVVWRSAKSSWMLAGSLFMIASIVLEESPIVWGCVFSYIGVAVITTSLVATEYLLQKREQQTSQTTSFDDSILNTSVSY